MADMDGLQRGNQEQAPQKGAAVMNSFQLTSNGEKASAQCPSKQCNTASHYLNVAQKGKLILPTALWILLIIAGICFITLLATLSRTLGTLDTLVELEQERTDLWNHQNLVREYAHTRQHSNYHNDKQPLASGSKGDSDKRHKVTSTSTSTERPRHEPDSDLQFGDESISDISGLLGRLPPFNPKWFALPDWTSLEPERRRNDASRQPDLIVASIQSDDSNPGEAISMLDSIMGRFFGRTQRESARRPTEIFRPNDEPMTRFKIRFDSNEPFNTMHQNPIASSENLFDTVLEKLMDFQGNAADEQRLPLVKAMPPFRHSSSSSSSSGYPQQPDEQVLITMNGEPLLTGRPMQHLHRVKPFKNHRHEPYEVAATAGPILFTNGNQPWANDHRRLHEKMAAAATEAKEQQEQQEQQWQSLSGQMADSLLQSFLPPMGPPSVDKSSQEDVVISDGNKLDPSESQKVLNRFFGPKLGYATTSSSSISSNPIDQIGELLNTMLTIPNDTSSTPSFQSIGAVEENKTGSEANEQKGSDIQTSTTQLSSVPVVIETITTGPASDSIGLSTSPQFGGSSQSISSNNNGSGTSSGGSGSSNQAAKTGLGSEASTGPLETMTTITGTTESVSSTSASKLATSHAITEGTLPEVVRVETTNPSFQAFMGFSDDPDIGRAKSSNSNVSPSISIENTTTIIETISSTTMAPTVTTHKATIKASAAEVNAAPVAEVISGEDMSEASALDLTPFAKLISDSLATQRPITKDWNATTVSSVGASQETPPMVAKTSGTSQTNTTAPTIKPKDGQDRPFKTLLKKADEFLDRSVSSIMQMF